MLNVQSSVMCVCVCSLLFCNSKINKKSTPQIIIYKYFYISFGDKYYSISTVYVFYVLLLVSCDERMLRNILLHVWFFLLSFCFLVFQPSTFDIYFFLAFSFLFSYPINLFLVCYVMYAMPEDCTESAGILKISLACSHHIRLIVTQKIYKLYLLIKIYVYMYCMYMLYIQ